MAVQHPANARSVYVQNAFVTAAVEGATPFGVKTSCGMGMEVQAAVAPGGRTPLSSRPPKPLVVALKAAGLISKKTVMPAPEIAAPVVFAKEPWTTTSYVSVVLPGMPLSSSVASSAVTVIAGGVVGHSTWGAGAVAGTGAGAELGGGTGVALIGAIVVGAGIVVADGRSIAGRVEVAPERRCMRACCWVEASESVLLLAAYHPALPAIANAVTTTPAISRLERALPRCPSFGRRQVSFETVRKREGPMNHLPGACRHIDATSPMLDIGIKRQSSHRSPELVQRPAADAVTLS